MKILGISAYYHDAAAALLIDGQVAAAAQEERFTRKKHDSSFPHHAIAACLQATGTRPSEIDFVAFYDKPFLKFERLLETYLAFAPKGFASFRTALPVWVKDKLFQRGTLLQELKNLQSGIDWDKRLLFSEHHLSHAASAYFPSPFDSAAVLTMDGVGEWTTTSVALGSRRELREMDLAASIQAVTEEVVLKLARGIAKDTGEKNLCLAGGVALNCVANGKLLRDGSFEKLWLQPAAGDAGGALGAALVAYHLHASKPRHLNGAMDGMRGGYLGPQFANDEIQRRLNAAGAVFEVLTDEQVVEESAKALADGKALGWFQGRMEFGPRALGARSILGDARSPSMQKQLNLKVKYRESFRPFAPAVLAEDAPKYFGIDRESPYMLLVADVTDEHRIAMTEEEQKLFGIEKLNVPRSSIPAVTHVDYSARVQTVHRETNPRFHDLIGQFKQKTGCPVIVNTHFNMRAEPIVGSPES